MTPPRWPIYIPSLGRADRTLCTFPVLLEETGVPFSFVVEPQEYDEYASSFPNTSILVLPDSGKGISYARNWMKDHAREAGAERHWQIDDNLFGLFSFDGRRRTRVDPGYALGQSEAFFGRYANVALAGLRSGVYVYATKVPFRVNHLVMTCVLVDNSTPFRYRGGGGSDIDYSLQVIAGGLCTITLNAFYYIKPPKLTLPGGCSGTYYSAEDGLLRIAQGLRRRWPRLIEIVRKDGRPGVRVKIPPGRPFGAQLERVS